MLPTTSAGSELPTANWNPRDGEEKGCDVRRMFTGQASTEIHVKKTGQRAQAILEACKFERINQVSPSRVQEYLAKLRADGRSTGTSNHYLRAIRMFTRWLVRDRRTNEDRRAYMSRLNDDADRRRVRRLLPMEEFTRLLEAAEVDRPFSVFRGRIGRSCTSSGRTPVTGGARSGR